MTKILLRLHVIEQFKLFMRDLPNVTKAPRTFFELPLEFKD